MKAAYIVLDGAIAVYGADTEKEAVKWAQEKAADIVSRAFLVFKIVARVKAVVTETKVTFSGDR